MTCMDNEKRPAPSNSAVRLFQAEETAGAEKQRDNQSDSSHKIKGRSQWQEDVHDTELCGSQE